MESTLYSVTSKCNLAILSRKWNFLVHCTLLYGGIISCLRGIKCLFFPWDIYLKSFIVTLSLTVFCHPSSLCYFSHRRDTHLPQNLCTAWNTLSSYLWDSLSPPSGLCSDVILSMSPYSVAFEIPPPAPHHHTVLQSNGQILICDTA